MQRSRSRTRSRDRSRDRSHRRRSRSRSASRNRRHRSRSISRSVSRELYGPADPPIVEIKKIVDKQRDCLVDLLADHRAEVDEKLSVKTRRFSSKPIERQFHINAGFKEMALKAQQALEASEIGRARDQLDHLVAQLEEHEENLIIADSSPHGWLAVSKVRSHKELPKSLRKKLAQVEKELDSKRPRSRYGGTQRRFGGVQREGQEVLTRRNGRRLSPEEALIAASKQIKPGLCVHCNKGLHFYKECPSFWAKVQESREAQVKSSGHSSAAITN